MILQGDALEVLKTLPDESVNMCVTSPPYLGLRDYGVDGQIGLENTPEEYIQRLVDVFHEVKRVLKNDGTLWVNIGDSYWGSGSRGYDFTGKWSESSKVQAANGGTQDLSSLPKLVGNKNGIKNKDLIGIPWMLAFALRDDGWWLRQDIIWDKSGNCFPESVKDRCTKAHEYIFLLSKQPSYFYDADAIKEPVKEVSLNRVKYGWHGSGDNGKGNYAGLEQVEQMGDRFCKPDGRNKRDVWHVNTHSYSGAHFATFPEKLIEPCILAGTSNSGGATVLDPFSGAGTTGVVCAKLGREYIGIEINPEYVKMSEERIAEVVEMVEAEKAQIKFW